MEDSTKLPYWVLKTLPVLTGHVSLTDFEKWVYLPTSEKSFPKELYLEFISFDYRKSLSDFLELLRDFIPLEQRWTLYIIVDFLKSPEYMDFIDKDKFKLLPASNMILEHAWEKINKISEDIYWNELEEKFFFKKETKELLSSYIRTFIFLLRDGDKTVIDMVSELNRIYK